MYNPGLVLEVEYWIKSVQPGMTKNCHILLLLLLLYNPGHMTKIATTPIYGKNPSKIFSGTGGPISTKLGMKHL